MNSKATIIPLVFSVVLLTGCSRKATAVASQATAVATSMSVSHSESLNSSCVMALPTVRIYRMRGDYADLVPISLGSDGQLISYPDPIDITPSQKPVTLGDGWYLDRRGVGVNTAFTSYTYEEYHAMKHVPSQAELKAHIIDKQGVSELWNCGTGRRSIEQYKQLVKDGFPGCTKVK